MITKSIKYLLMVIIVFAINSCKEKDDKDFIIDVVKNLKGCNNIDKMDKYLTFDLDTKENLHSKIEDLIDDLKYAELPKKDEIIKYNNNGEYQGYEFTLEPIHIKYLISNTIIDKKIRKVNHIGRIKGPGEHPKILH